MPVCKGKPSVSEDDLLSLVSEVDLLRHYFSISELPCLIHSPLRKDKNPSFSMFTYDNIRVGWKDFATKERGTLMTLLCRYWGLSLTDVILKVYHDLPNISLTSASLSLRTNNHPKKHKHKKIGNITLACKVREWRDYDLEYWESYGVTLKWLKWAEVYPISHKIIYKEDKRYVFGADKYAYAYIEHKEGKTSIKIYQPFNKLGFKWSNNHDGSVISLWTKIPKTGDKLCICSSLKDSLCLSNNLGIPAICPQGEGYSLSQTAVNVLKSRFKNIYILLDNDEAGMVDGEKLALQTGFKNIILPKINECKDISDLYKSLNNKNQFINILKPLFL